MPTDPESLAVVRKLHDVADLIIPQVHVAAIPRWERARAHVERGKLCSSLVDHLLAALLDWEPPS